MPDCERRELGLKGLRLRSVADDYADGRTIEGLAVPFGDVIDTFWDGPETFDRDCEFVDVENAKLCYQHDQLIGRITGAESRDDGLHITARIADTQLGRDAVALLNEGALDSLSVGFVPILSERDKDGITHRRKVRLLETSLVSWPAYEAAKLTAHRDIDHTTNPTNERSDTMASEEMTQILERMNDMEESQRRLAADLTARGGEPARLGGQYRSSGEFLQAFERGDETAFDVYRQIIGRDFTGTTFADTATQTQWMSDMIRIVQSRRSVLGLFASEPLPEKGETIGYKVLATNTIKVDKQENEGDDLKFGKVTLTTKTANVYTYGGYTKLSRQSIERGDPAALSTAMTAMTIAYAVNTEAAARAHLYAEIKAQASASNKLEVAKDLTALTAEDWIDVIVDASDALDEKGAVIGTLGVSGDVYKTLAKLSRDGNALMNVSGLGADTLGVIDLAGTDGSMQSVRVKKLPGAAAGTVAFLDPQAVKKWESSGAPFRLQDSDIVKLTEDYSIYGYMAFGTPWPDGILPVVKKAAV